MHQFSKDHVFILPLAEKYRQLYSLSLDDVLTCLNTPDTSEGLNTDHYTAEKALRDHRIYVYYYLTYSILATDNAVYAIVDFIGYTGTEDRPAPPSKN